MYLNAGLIVWCKNRLLFFTLGRFNKFWIVNLPRVKTFGFYTVKHTQCQYAHPAAVFFTADVFFIKLAAFIQGWVVGKVVRKNFYGIGCQLVSA